MQFIGILLVFGGYTLVYAATAHGGRFATEPWAGLYADAYGNPGQDAVIPGNLSGNPSFAPNAGNAPALPLPVFHTTGRLVSGGEIASRFRTILGGIGHRNDG